MTENKQPVTVESWPQAFVKAVEIFINRSVIGAIFVIFMYGTYDIHLRQLENDEVNIKKSQLLISKLLENYNSCVTEKQSKQLN